MIFRISSKLARKVKYSPNEIIPVDDYPLADWSAHLFIAQRNQYVILTNTASLYSVVLLGAGISDCNLFIKRAIGCIREAMEADELAQPFHRHVVPHAGSFQFSKALNRSVTGSMNDLIFHAKSWLIERGCSPFDAGFKLNDMPCSMLDYRVPREAIRSLADSHQKAKPRTAGARDDTDRKTSAELPVADQTNARGRVRIAGKAKAFSAKRPTAKGIAGERVYQFKISLVGAAPPIWRRIQIFDCTLDQLHGHIQTAMGWHNCHLHQFDIKGVCHGDPSLLEGDFNCVDSTQTMVSGVLPKSGKRFGFRYMYDFGDSWKHEILFEGCLAPTNGKRYPLCLEGERACPLEDVGGVWGYQNFLAAIANPNHEEHEDFLEWCGGEFSPEDFDPAAATKKMKRGLPNWRER